MGSKTTSADGLAARENCRRMVEEWLIRDLRRLLRLPASGPIDKLLKNSQIKAKELLF